MLVWERWRCVESAHAACWRGLFNVVGSYVHLGFHVDRGVTFKPEALRRLSQAAAACKEIRGLVLQNVHIPRPTRAQLFSALVESTFFTLELWQQDVGSAWEKLVAGHSRLQRSLLAKELPAMELLKLTPADVTFLLGTPSLLALLRAKRLRYLVTLVGAAPPALWAVLKCEKEWLARVVEDLAWLCSLSTGPWPAVAREAWPLWWHEIKDRPGRFKRQIGLAVQRDTLNGLPAAFMCETDRAMQKEAVAQGRETSRRHAGHQFFCAACQLPFRSLSNLACHFRHVHNRRADHLHYAGGTICCGCGAQHHTMGRILNHLKTVPRCWQAVRGAGLISDEPHAGEGSRLRLREAFENPRLVPACPAGRVQLLYDDGNEGVLLPREKAVLRAASSLGGSIEDWVALHVDASYGDVARHSLWHEFCSCLRQYPFYSSEFQEVINRTKADIVELQPETLCWDSACFEFVVGCLAEWGNAFSIDILVDTDAAAATEKRRAGTVLRELKVQPMCRFQYVAEQLIVLFGDALPDKERTHLLDMCRHRRLQVRELGWNLASFRDVNFSRVGAVHCSIAGSWEMRDGPLLHHDWGTLVFHAWTEDVRLHQAGLCRIFGHVLRLMWKLLLQGRALAFHFCCHASAILNSQPLQRVRSVGTWCAWHDSDAFCWATAAQSGANSLVKACCLGDASLLGQRTNLQACKRKEVPYS